MDAEAERKTRSESVLTSARIPTVARMLPSAEADAGASSGVMEKAPPTVSEAEILYRRPSEVPEDETVAATAPSKSAVLQVPSPMAFRRPSIVGLSVLSRYSQKSSSSTSPTDPISISESILSTLRTASPSICRLNPASPSCAISSLMSPIVGSAVSASPSWAGIANAAPESSTRSATIAAVARVCMEQTYTRSVYNPIRKTLRPIRRQRLFFLTAGRGIAVST